MLLLLLLLLPRDAICPRSRPFLTSKLSRELIQSAEESCRRASKLCALEEAKATASLNWIKVFKVCSFPKPHCVHMASLKLWQKEHKQLVVVYPSL